MELDPICRICMEPSSEVDKLISPCSCSGSVKWIHRKCLDEWRSSHVKPTSFSRCELCKFNYVIDVQPETEIRNRFIRDTTIDAVKKTLEVWVISIFLSICNWALEQKSGYKIIKTYCGTSDDCSTWSSYAFIHSMYGIISVIGGLLIGVVCYSTDEKWENSPLSNSEENSFSIYNKPRDNRSFILIFLLNSTALLSGHLWFVLSGLSTVHWTLWRIAVYLKSRRVQNAEQYHVRDRSEV